jgi:hypothetical protein
LNTGILELILEPGGHRHPDVDEIRIVIDHLPNSFSLLLNQLTVRRELLDHNVLKLL